MRLAWFGFLLFAPSSAYADPLWDQLVASARAVGSNGPAWTRTVTMEQRKGGKIERRISVEQWDPARPANQRWTLLSIDGRAPSPDEHRKFRQDKAREKAVGYASIATCLPAIARRAGDAADRVVYHMTRLPKGCLIAADSDISAHLRAEATIDMNGPRPFIARMRMTIVEPVRIKLVAKLDRLDTISTFQRTSNGWPAPLAHTTEMTGSLLGMRGLVRVDMTYAENNDPETARD